MKKKMKNKKTGRRISVQGIKDMPGSINQLMAQCAAVRSRLIESFPRFVARYDGPKYVKRGSTIKLDVKGLPLPDVDLWNGKLVKRAAMLENYPINVYFYGGKKPVFTPAKYDARKGRVSVIVPEEAESGVLVLLCPVKELYGPAKELKKSGAWKLLGKSLGNMRAVKEGSAKSGNGVPCREFYLDKFDIEAIRYYALYAVSINVTCARCKIQCPNNAIRFNEMGLCYVDTARCQGQKFLRTGNMITAEDGRELFERGPEEICWQCFEGSEQYSNRCPYKKLRRVMHHNGICCASCQDECRVVGLRLDELCAYNAISIGYVAPGDTSFMVDKEKCEGCFVCYNNINCYNNFVFSDINTNYTLRMVSHVGRSMYEFHLIILDIKLEPYYLTDPANYEFPSRRYLLRIITEDGSQDIRFQLDKNWSVSFQNLKVAFHERAHFALFARTTSGMLQLVGNHDGSSNVAIGTVMNYLHEHFHDWQQVPGGVRIRTSIGYFTIRCRLTAEFIGPDA